MIDFPEVHDGFGRHRYYLSADHYQHFQKLSFVEWVLTFFTLTVSKVSICLLLLRIVIDEKIVRPIQGLIAFLVASMIVIMLLWILQCSPVDAAWNATKKERARCFSKGQIERIILTHAGTKNQLPCQGY